MAKKQTDLVSTRDVHLLLKQADELGRGSGVAAVDLRCEQHGVGQVLCRLLLVTCSRGAGVDNGARSRRGREREVREGRPREGGEKGRSKCI